MAARAIDIVYQLNASEDADQQVYQRGASPLEAISFDGSSKSDVVLRVLPVTIGCSRFNMACSAQEAKVKPIIWQSGKRCFWRSNTSGSSSAILWFAGFAFV